MENKTKAANLGLILHIAISLVLIAVGALMIFVKASLVSNILYNYSVYGVVAFAAVAGIIFIVRYFVKDEYKLISNYGFTKGAFLVVLSAVLVVNATEAAGYIDLVFNCLALVIGTIIFQESLSMKYMNNSAWGLALVMGILIIAGSIVMILDVNKLVSARSVVYYGYLTVSGFLSIISLLMNLFSAKKDSRTIQPVTESVINPEVQAEAENPVAETIVVNDNNNYEN